MLLLAGIVTTLAPAGVLAEETLSISGSTTVLPIISAEAEAFMDKNPDVDIQVSGGGSGAGIKAVNAGTVDIGMSSRALKAEEEGGLLLIPVAKDGIAIIVNTANPLTTITLPDLKKIYTGEITGWQDLDGETGKIEVVGRDSASGTREFFFEKVLDKEDFTKFMLEKNSNGAVQQYVSQTPAAIGYVGMGFEEGVKVIPITIDGKETVASVQTVKSGAYPLSRELYLVTSGEAKGHAKEFIDFVLSAEGQKIAEEAGFVALK